MLYAVGDIHGELELLEELLGKLELKAEDRLVFLGDYVDRGPDASGVVDLLLGLRARHQCVFLLGNHESMFLDFLGWKGEAYFGGDAFLSNGGGRTLASYGFFDAQRRGETFDLSPEHRAFYEQCVLSHRDGDYLFVHAGLAQVLLDERDVDFALRRSRAEDLLWNRTTGDLPHRLGVTIIYGHTPRHDFEVRHNEPFSIGIDTGAVYGGPLTAIRLPDETVIQSRWKGAVEIEEPE
jgi:serine/threonine protein phosphatase 1